MSQVNGFTGGQPMHIVGRDGGEPLVPARFGTFPAGLPDNVSDDDYRSHRREAAERREANNAYLTRRSR